MREPRRLERRFPGLELESVVGNLPELLMGHLHSTDRIAIIFEVDADRYVQCMATERRELIVECVSNRYLRGDKSLSIDEECALLELGFNLPEPESAPHPNFWWRCKNGPMEIMSACKLISTVLTAVFHLGHGSFVEMVERPIAKRR